MRRRGEFTYVPHGGFSGTDHIQFTVSDAPAGTTPAATTLTVTVPAGAHVVALLNASATSSCSVSGIKFTAR